ncbi:sugar transferase (PEP-CTERM system associated)/exopolysaccharide biosynthesis polyprenyl glycosylphosphotransferase [Luteibacter rhizovicinus]|uniref:Sugar transferase (PEP-CTERM system associated)/exopolysaccharide biosynthesis polyprenyl glycosylphosphotransferase n=1 Tax=Luteibacter rhizovicinus TaxID=242606 RepID=A0A4R3YYE2_9GAMM|nr:TIGR03013 family XrtA/PEP-CTERM system glycosyltransferase [Luteibacter rhizovicinus]TCV97626.1 sugar transferase (PEP-CTERM system associated)/exopolysaccharide biosynthesis polyprenyl glycosylphosphotransferase [Luteibacter rhizovicinus]
MLRILRLRIVRWLLLLALCELLLLAGSLNVAMYLRFFLYPDDLAEFTRHLPQRSAVFAIVIFLGMLALGEYRTHLRTNWLGIVARQAVAFVLGGIGLVVVYYAIPQAYVGRGVLSMALVLGFLTVAIFRIAFMRLVEIEALKRRVLILGAGDRAAQIHNRMRRRSDRRGFTVVGYLRCPNDPVVVPEQLVLTSDMPLHLIAARYQVDEIVVGVDDRRGRLPMDALLECRQAGVTITDLTTFFERESGRLQLSMLDPSWLVFSRGFNATPIHLLGKRCFDLLAAGTMLVLFWPLMLAVALAIRLESGRGQPVLYLQERVGEHGKTFWLYKFRSMRTDAECDGVARWACQSDNRVTRVGRICRKLRFDELPQLWNVLKGEMSIVGPRPERPQFVADLATKIRYYSLRHCLKPGLAGWAQLSYPYGASEEDAAEKLKYDLFYVKNHNLLLDMVILIETVEVILFGRGAR